MTKVTKVRLGIHAFNGPGPKVGASGPTLNNHAGYGMSTVAPRKGSGEGGGGGGGAKRKA